MSIFLKRNESGRAILVFEAHPKKQMSELEISIEHIKAEILGNPQRYPNTTLELFEPAPEDDG